MAIWRPLCTQIGLLNLSFGTPLLRASAYKIHPLIQESTHSLNLHIISLNFSYEKPLKLNWQHSLTADVTGGIISSPLKDNVNNNKTKSHSFSAFANYSLGYYPNTRTNIPISASQQISKYLYDDKDDALNYGSMLSANLYYYFSPNLRLTGEYSLQYMLYRPINNSFTSLFYIQLNYSIF